VVGVHNLFCRLATAGRHKRLLATSLAFVKMKFIGRGHLGLHQNNVLLQKVVVNVLEVRVQAILISFVRQ
jgi:hypothetical protein